MTEPTTDTCTTFAYSWSLDPAGSEVIFKATENVGWGLAGPHASLAASGVWATQLFYSNGYEEQVVGEALKDVWNRILARNMAYTEGMIQLMVSSGREAVGYFEEGASGMVAGACDKVANAAEKMLWEPDVAVEDGQ